MKQSEMIVNLVARLCLECFNPFQASIKGDRALIYGDYSHTRGRREMLTDFESITEFICMIGLGREMKTESEANYVRSLIRLEKEETFFLNIGLANQDSYTHTRAESISEDSVRVVGLLHGPLRANGWITLSPRVAPRNSQD